VIIVCGSEPSSVSASSAQPGPQAPAPTTPAGAILLLSTRSLTVANLIHAHRSPLALLSVNPAGTMVASASVKVNDFCLNDVPSLCSSSLVHVGYDYSGPFHSVWSEALSVSKGH
jgi:hypothetical protein